MFREMRRFKQQLSAAEAREILEKGSYGVLACAGDDGYPYAVPLSYVLEGQTIFFHCAMEGHKIDALRRSDKVSFCVVSQDLVVPEELTTYFASAIAFGRARLVEDASEKYAALMKFGLKYEPGMDAHVKEHVEQSFSRTALVAIDIEHLTGKEAIELTRRRSKS